MACCGKNRMMSMSRPVTPFAEQIRTGLRQSQENSNPGLFFKYVGNKKMTVIGPISGRAYQFNGFGSTSAVDPRDAPSVAAVPHLILVSHP
jgi:hypothetical protein